MNALLYQKYDCKISRSTNYNRAKFKNKSNDILSRASGKELKHCQTSYLYNWDQIPLAKYGQKVAENWILGYNGKIVFVAIHTKHAITHLEVQEIKTRSHCILWNLYFELLYHWNTYWDISLKYVKRLNEIKTDEKCGKKFRELEGKPSLRDFKKHVR